MKALQTRQLIYTTLLFCAIALTLHACKSDWISPGEIPPVTDSTGNGGTPVPPDTLPSFNAPTGVAVDASGNIYVADWGNNLIRKITPAGTVSTFAGSGFAGYNDGAGNLASFTQPTGITIDPQGNLFVADAGNDLIRKINPTGTVSTIAGSDTSGFANGAGAAAVFFDPVGVAVDANDNVYVADAGNSLIRLVSSGGSVSTFAGSISSDTSFLISPFNNPTGVALGPNGNVFVANYLDNNILQISQSGTVSTYAGIDTLQGANNGPAAQATFYYPNNVAVDASGNLYVSDGVNNLIRKITTDGMVSTFAGNGMAGAVDSTGVNASFNGPTGLAFDAAGNLYVADSNNNEIRKITPAGVVTTVAGTGIQGSQNGIAVARRNKRSLKPAIKVVRKSRLDMIYHVRLRANRLPRRT